MSIGTNSRKVNRLKICIVLSIILISLSCTKKSKSSKPDSSGWTENEIGEVSDWHFNSMSSKMQTLATRGDNAKKSFSNCWTLKMANEYSYGEFKKAWKEFDEYSLKNKVVISTESDVDALGLKFPVYQRTGEFAVQCGNELNM